jgi:hypothetical protein
MKSEKSQGHETKFKGVTEMKKLIAIATLGLALSFAIFSSSANAATVRWSETIGIIQGGSVVGSGTGQVTGAPGPWSATVGSARVNLQTGRIRFIVRGLVLAASNNIGTPGPITLITGTLVCDTDGSAGGGNSTLVDTPLIPLSSEGDAEFKGEIGPLPDSCLNEPDIVFLIRAFGTLWIGNGAVRERRD